MALVAVTSSCADRTSVDAASRDRPYSTSELEGFVLRPDEGPPGTRFVEGGSGPLSVEQMWPSSCCPAQQEAFDDAAYRAGYGALFVRPGHSGEPIDTRPGFEVVNSEAALFVTEEGATEAMGVWVDYHEASELDALPAEGLGEDAAAFVGSPNAPAETVVLFFWRKGRLVLFLRATGGTGTVRVEEVRGWAGRMDRRAS